MIDGLINYHPKRRIGAVLGLVVLLVLVTTAMYHRLQAGLAPYREENVSIAGLGWEDAVDTLSRKSSRDLVVDVTAIPKNWNPRSLPNTMPVSTAIEALGLEWQSSPQRAVGVLAPRIDWTEMSDRMAHSARQMPTPLSDEELRKVGTELRNGEPAATPLIRKLVCRLAQRRLATEFRGYQTLVQPKELGRIRLSIIRPRGGNGARFLQMKFSTGSLIAWKLPEDGGTRLTSVSPSRGALLHLSNVPLDTALERIAQHAGFKIHISPELAAGKRVTVHSIGSSYDELLDAIAGEFDLKCSPTPEGRLLDVMPLVRYEKVGLHLVQQSQSYAQRRTFEFMRRLSTSELNRLEKGESVSISSLSTECRVPIEDAVRASVLIGN